MPLAGRYLVGRLRFSLTVAPMVSPMPPFCLFFVYHWILHARRDDHPSLRPNKTQDVTRSQVILFMHITSLTTADPR
ncbi:hypothetical protein BJY52DRAFT_1255730 [Lactarius psammicola]|nr:hypothetical protein BJY52DRAFT_1255730 [Lactarius psammicola]